MRRLELQELLDLLVEVDGVLSWRRSWGRYKQGPVSFWLDPRGYQITRIKGVDYKVHRLLFALREGRMPVGQIDHVNGDKTDNSRQNLRECDARQNQQNRGVNKNNTSGFPGVSYMRRIDRWRAYVNVDRKQVHLGYYRTPEQAAAVQAEAKARLHDFSPAYRSASPAVKVLA